MNSEVNIWSSTWQVSPLYFSLGRPTLCLCRTRPLWSWVWNDAASSRHSVPSRPWAELRPKTKCGIWTCAYTRTRARLLRHDKFYWKFRVGETRQTKGDQSLSQRYTNETRRSGLAPKCVRLTSNGINPGFFQIRLQNNLAFCAQSELDWREMGQTRDFFRSDFSTFWRSAKMY